MRLLSQQPGHVLSEEHARFYTACISHAIEHLHSRHLVYRDCKPENVMLTATGYVKLVDFGLAKRVHTRTHTLCGTPEYLAPEMVAVRGHGKAVDWWALGVLLYEMVLGATPWIIDPATLLPDFDLPPDTVYKAILNPRFALHLPSTLSPELRSFVCSLLAWEPLNRLGSLTRGAEDVKEHPFFAREAWDALLNERAPAPFVPRLSDDADTSKFVLGGDTQGALDGFLNEPMYDDENGSAWDCDF